MDLLSKALSGNVLLNQDQTSRNHTQKWLPRAGVTALGAGPALSHSPLPLGHPPSASSFAPWTTWQSPKLNISSGVGAAPVVNVLPAAIPGRLDLVPLHSASVSPPHLRHSQVLLQLLGPTIIYSPFTQSVPGKAASPWHILQSSSSLFCCLCALHFPSSFLSQELHHPKMI